MTAIVLTGGKLFDGVGPELREGVEILVEGGRIKEVSDRPITAAGAQVIKLGGRTLMPGLIDCHWHINAADVNLSRLDGMPETLRAQHSRIYLEQGLDRGFTSVRDTGGCDFGIARAVEEGLIKGPRVFFGGRAMSQTGGHGDLRLLQNYDIRTGAYQGALGQVADGPHALRAAIREEFRKGAHHIKIMGSGGVASPTDPLEHNQYSEDEIRAAVDECAMHGSYTAAHCHPDIAVERCTGLGVRSIEHATLITPETAARVAARGSYVVPTMVIIFTLHELGAQMGLPQVSQDKLAKIKDSALRSLEIMKRAGVKMCFGTDLLGGLHPQQSREFLLRREVLPAIDILRSATSVAAELLMREGELGVVKSGAVADLIVVDGDPLKDMALFQDQGRHIPLIMKEGRLHKNAL